MSITGQEKGENSPVSFDLTVRPTALELQMFQSRCRIEGRVPTRQEMARSIGMPLSTYEGYYYGKRQARMPAPDYTLLRITWNALMLAEWQRECRPKTE